jgi:hypothetical protein
VLRTRTEADLAVTGGSGLSVRRDDLTVAHVPRPRAGRQQVTVLTVLDEPTARMFWELYVTAFGPLRTRAAQRQVLHEDEFYEEMNDPRVWKYVVYDSSGQPVGLSTLTKHLDAITWISPEYYAARYPQHYARQAVYYLGFALVAKGARHLSSFATMIEAIAAAGHRRPGGVRLRHLRLQQRGDALRRAHRDHAQPLPAGAGRAPGHPDVLRRGPLRGLIQPALGVKAPGLP